MASRKFPKGSDEWQMFTAFWKLCQKYWEPEDDDKYWQDLIQDVNDFSAKYNNLFAKNVALAFIDTLEEWIKKDKK